MVTVEIRTAHPATTPDRLLATLTVHDDATYDLVDDDGILDLEETMVLPGPQRLTFRQDPEGWARALPANLTSPYGYGIITDQS